MFVYRICKGRPKDNMYMEIRIQGRHECNEYNPLCVCVPRCACVLIGSSHRAADGSIKESLNGLAPVNS